MKKIISFILFAFVLVNTAWCGFVDTLTAKTVAHNFYQARISQSNKLKSQSLTDNQIRLKIAHQEFVGSAGLKSTSEPVYYIFNVGENHGFVIVSADDRTTPILGFSLDGEYNENDNQPPAFKEWMSYYKRQISFLKANDLKSAFTANPEWSQYLSTQILKSTSLIEEVVPLVTATWNQADYYNRFCPENAAGHALVGCVATAMGQIMKFWEQPVICTAIPGYTDQPNYDGSGDPIPNSDYGAIPNVNPTTYSWTTMPDHLTSQSLAAQKDAVSELLYHCGVAVQMNYGPTGSGAYVSNADDALRDYFNYSSTTKLVYRTNYSGSAWKNLIMDELNNGRPVLYSGDNNGSLGHAFVCDGYQDTDFFHFNWGWGGYADNYFYLDDITPLTLDFTDNQMAIVGIAPENLANTEDIYLSDAAVTSSAIVDAGGTVDVEVDQNYSGNSATVPNVYLRYYLSMDCTLGGIDILLGEDNSTIDNANPSETEIATLTIPDGTISGSYKVLFVADATNVVTESNENNNYACVDITVNGTPVPEDITLSNVAATSSTTVDAGTTIDVEVNQNYSGGSNTVPIVYLHYYLSTDCLLDGSDLFLDEDYSTINSDDAFDTETATLVIPEETAAGTYHILFVADATDVVEESDENNNYACFEITVNESVIPEDVSLSNALLNSSDTVYAGGFIDVEIDQNYSGSSNTVPNVYLYYYLSTDCTLDVSDVYLDKDYSTVGSDDAFDTETATLTIPEETPDGNYYVLFVADATDVVEESNNENNYACIEITVKPVEVIIESISIEGPSIVAEDSTAIFTCTATYSDSAMVDVTALATWEISSINALIDSGFVLTASVIADENCTITATYEGKSAAFNITIQDIPPVLVSLTIEGPYVIEEDSSAIFTCVAMYSDSSTVDVSSIVFWEINSSNALIDSGLVSTASVKTDENCTITATYEGKSAAFDITIQDVPPVLVYLTIEGPAHIDEDSSANYTCTATYSDSTMVDVTALAAWESGSVNTTIDSGLLLTGSIIADENCTITATYEGKSAAYDIIVKDIPPTLVYLTILGSAVIDEDSSAIYTCTATYSDSSIVDVTALAIWETSSANAGFKSGILTASSVHTDESCTITATYEGKSASYDIIIQNVPAALLFLTIDGPSVVSENSSVIYSCMATYSDSTMIEIKALTFWEISTASAEISSGVLSANMVNSDEDCTITANWEGKTASQNVVIKDHSEENTLLLWEDGFEKDSLGKFPEDWIKEADATNSAESFLDGNYKTEGDKSLQLYGTVGGCMEALAFKFVGREMYSVSVDVKCGKELLTGCYPVRAGIALRKETSKLSPIRPFIEFKNDGKIYAGETDVLQPYNENVWINVLINYEMVSGDQVKTTYRIDNKIAGEFYTALMDAESELNYLQLAAYEGTAWFDNIKVYRKVKTNAENAGFEKTLKIYPNPVKDFVTVSFETPGLLNSDVKIINALGGTVMIQKLDSYETKIDLSGLVSGIYILKIQKNGFVYNEKIIK